MVGNKLDLLNVEIQKYLGIPYFKNSGKYKNHGSNAFVGKGTAHEIALETINLANQENIKLVDFTTKEIYNFQKKHHLGIDCSGLACHLLNLIFDRKLNPRRTSADMLTSLPLSKKVNPKDIQVGDLIRQKDGHHVLITIGKTNEQINFIDSSFAGRGVRLGSFSLTDKNFKHDGVYRLI
jgi:hypothetical protein